MYAITNKCFYYSSQKEYVKPFDFIGIEFWAIVTRISYSSVGLDLHLSQLDMTGKQESKEVKQTRESRLYRKTNFIYAVFVKRNFSSKIVENKSIEHD